MKKIFHEYFSFSRKESVAAITLAIIIALIISLPYYFANKKAKEPVNAEFAKIASNAVAASDSAANDEVEERSNFKYNKKEVESYTINAFEFDPNTIDENGFAKLGLPQKLIKTILNYRGKGGKFYKPDDFRKIWGLKQEDADKLVPYIVINTPNSSNKFNSNFSAKNNVKVISSIDINTASVNDFRQLPGVGNLAYKIVKYRDKLGGFLSINQVRETYDVTDSIYNAMLPYLTLQTTTINKLNINTANDFELGGHPYISKEIAKAIVIYRTQHGNYKTVQDLKKIIFIKKDIVDKIAPYLTTE